MKAPNCRETTLFSRRLAGEDTVLVPRRATHPSRYTLHYTGLPSFRAQDIALSPAVRMTKSAYLPYGRAGSTPAGSPLLRVHGILSCSHALAHVLHMEYNS